jgi:hypothetical protein
MAGAAQGLLVVVFSSAGLVKLASREELIRTLATIPWVRPKARRTIAFAVPVLELATAALLVVWPTAGAVLAMTVLLLFLVVVVLEFIAGRRLQCSCFGGAVAASGGERIIVRDLALVVAALPLFLSPAHATLPQLLTGAGGGLLFLLVEFGTDTVHAAGQS